MKKAFSLIEVVFAIVIISISLMSVPMLLKQSSKSNEASIIQESILAASTKIGNILSYPWDGNSYDSTNKVLRVLDVSSSGDSELKRDLATLNSNYRIGHIIGNQRRRFFDYSGGAGIVNPGTSTNSIAQFNLVTTTIGGSGAYDYKDSNIQMTSKVFYISDLTDYSNTVVDFNVSSTPIVNSTNIRMIELNTTSPLLNKSFVLRTFTCNIGQAGLLSRTY